MPSPLRRRVRLLLVSMVGVISMVAGTILVFRLMRVETLDTLPTQVLLAVLGLLILPVLSAWMFWLQRSLALPGPVEPREFQPLAVMLIEPEPMAALTGAFEAVVEVPGRHAEAVLGRRPARAGRTRTRIHEAAPDQRRP